MNATSSRRGFSLIELLTVIAIIAILAAVIFPVMTSAKRKAQESNCLTNLHQIAMGVQMFKQDNRRYPIILGSEVHDMNGARWVESSGTPNMFENVRDAYLFAEYVKTIKMFHCPGSTVADSKDISEYNQSSPSDPRSKLAVYAYDSYDCYTKGYSGEGGPSNPFTETNGKVERHYRIDWATDADWIRTRSGLQPYPPKPGTPNDEAAAKEDYSRQLKFRNPPSDTVITWCSYHEDRSASTDPKNWHGQSLVVFLDGSAASIPANEVGQCMWRTRPKKS